MRKMRGYFLSDEELGKKDDDHKKLAKTRTSSWQPTPRVPPRRFLKRTALAFLAAAAVYLFFANIPVLGPNSRMRRPIYPLPDLHPDVSPLPGHFPPADQLPHPPDPLVKSNAVIHRTADKTFNGLVKFPLLGPSLQAVSSTQGAQPLNRNVMFAASSLQSASALLPVACQMASELKNYVHFALLGASTISLERLREINGFDDTCPVLWHDARPDHSEISTDTRMETAVVRAFHHINQYIHPQAIILDLSDGENTFFRKGAERHLAVAKTTTINLSPKTVGAVPWISKLDTVALKMWNNVCIDILIKVSPGSSGGLLRLLRSLSGADYSASAVPHITIELPHEVDPSTKRYLETFRWPPLHVANPTHNRYLTLKHRVSPKKLTREEASTRTLETFWPSHPQHSHVLILSPQAELSTQFFQYLKYCLLYYRHSSSAAFARWDRQLFGISLEQPLFRLDGRSFSPPLLANNDPTTTEISSAPFLWQSPASDAMLFFGDKWIELHDFAFRAARAKGLADVVPPVLSTKMLGLEHSSWLEYALMLGRLRNYQFLYPGKDAANHLATIHSELFHIPEEFSVEKKPKVEDASSGESEGERVERRVRARSENQLDVLPVLEFVPRELRPLPDLPTVNYAGAGMSIEDLVSETIAFSAAFRKQMGCDIEAAKKKFQTSLSAQDLFCNIG